MGLEGTAGIMPPNWHTTGGTPNLFNNGCSPSPHLVKASLAVGRNSPSAHPAGMEGEITHDGPVADSRQRWQQWMSGSSTDTVRAAEAPRQPWQPQTSGSSTDEVRAAEAPRQPWQRQMSGSSTDTMRAAEAPRQPWQPQMSGSSTDAVWVAEAATPCSVGATGAAAWPGSVQPRRGCQQRTWQVDAGQGALHSMWVGSEADGGGGGEGEGGAEGGRRGAGDNPPEELDLPDTDDEYGSSRDLERAMARMRAARAESGDGPTNASSRRFAPDFERGESPGRDAWLRQGFGVGHAYNGRRSVEGNGYVPITTWAVRNLWEHTTQSAFIQELDRSGFQGSYDYVYLPRHFDTGLGKGHAFVNFDTPEDAELFWGDWNQSWRPSVGMEHLPLSVVPATIQGHHANMRGWSFGKLRRIKNPEHRPFIPDI